MSSRLNDDLNSRRAVSAVAVVLGALLLSGPALAGGVTLYEVGTDDVGLASAGYGARAQDASTVLTNPAGMTKLGGTRLLLGGQFLYGDVQMILDDATSPALGTKDGGNGIGFMPGGSAFFTLSPSSTVKLGIGLAGNFGLAEEFDGDWAGRYYVQKATLMGLSFLPSVAFKLNDKVSLGLSLNAIYGIFENQVAVNNRGPLNPQAADGQLTLEARNWGWGGNLGLLFEPSEKTRIGITYTSEVKLNFATSPEFSGLAPRLETILNRRGLLDAEVDLGVTVPQSIMLSFYSKTGAKAALLGSFGWQEYSQFGKVEVGIVSANPTSLTAEVPYSDTWHAALGMQLGPGEPWLYNFGVAYDSSLQNMDHVSPTLPAGAAWRFGFGVRHQGQKSLSWGIAADYAYGGDLRVDKASPLPVELGGRGDLYGSFETVGMLFVTGNLEWKF